VHLLRQSIRFMSDSECVRFLQWALPSAGMRWEGFRRVRRQVCRRIGHRIRELRLRDADAYKNFFEGHAEEWEKLDSLLRVTISRFYRDRDPFNHLGQSVLPNLATHALERGDRFLRCWCVGSASGEEPYTLKIIWELEVAPRFPTLRLSIVATDIDGEVLDRAKTGIFASSSLKELPPGWKERVFERLGDLYRLLPSFREGIDFRQEDVRKAMPSGPFDLILSRNLIFTYFDAVLMRKLVGELVRRLVRGGVLMLGIHESLPSGTQGLSPLPRTRGIYTKS
jgi:chemotaxis protein methyltransferase CheR